MAASRSLAILLACLLCARALAQGTPSFVGDTQAGTAPTLVTADESTGKDLEDQGFGLASNYMSPAGEGGRLKYRGTGTTAYEEMELAASGAVGFGCGFGYVSPAFRPLLRPLHQAPV